MKACANCRHFQEVRHHETSGECKRFSSAKPSGENEWNKCEVTLKGTCTGWESKLV